MGKGNKNRKLNALIDDANGDLEASGRAIDSEKFSTKVLAPLDKKLKVNAANLVSAEPLFSNNSKVDLVENNSSSNAGILQDSLYESDNGYSNGSASSNECTQGVRDIDSFKSKPNSEMEKQIAGNVVQDNINLSTKLTGKSFSEAVKNNSSFPWTGAKPGETLDLSSRKSKASSFISNGKVHLDHAEAIARGSLFQFSLVGRVIGRRFQFDWLVNQLKKRWSNIEGLAFRDLGSECFMIQFPNQDSRDLVWLGGPWHVFGFPIGLDIWTPGFWPSRDAPMYAPLWIRLPSLPLEYWGSENLSRIGALVGDPICSDKFTARMERCSFVRICVRCDLQNPYPRALGSQGRLTLTNFSNMLTKAFREFVRSVV